MVLSTDTIVWPEESQVSVGLTLDFSQFAGGRP